MNANDRLTRNFGFRYLLESNFFQVDTVELNFNSISEVIFKIKTKFPRYAHF